MIYELRIYDAVPGKLPALSNRFRDVTMGYFQKHGFNVVGFWTDAVGTNNRLTYMLAFDDLAHYERSWASFAADQERLKIFADSEKDGPLVAKIQNTLMRPTAYSPAK